MIVISGDNAQRRYIAQPDKTEVTKPRSLLGNHCTLKRLFAGKAGASNRAHQQDAE